MDIVQEGITGLLVAAHRYNPNKAAFLTYARYYIKVVIDNYLATIGNKSPFNTKDHISAAAQAYHLLNSTQNETGEILQLEEVAQILGVSSRVLLQKLEAQAFNVISLDAPVRRGDEESTWGDILQVVGDVDIHHPYSTESTHKGREIHSIVLKEMRLNLSVREYNVVKMHYLDHSSLEEIA